MTSFLNLIHLVIWVSSYLNIITQKYSFSKYNRYNKYNLVKIITFKIKLTY